LKTSALKSLSWMRSLVATTAARAAPSRISPRTPPPSDKSALAR
jgi:hypothetical protein